MKSQPSRLSKCWRFLQIAVTFTFVHVELEWHFQGRTQDIWGAGAKKIKKATMFMGGVPACRKSWCIYREERELHHVLRSQWVHSRLCFNLFQATFTSDVLKVALDSSQFCFWGQNRGIWTGSRVHFQLCLLQQTQLLPQTPPTVFVSTYRAIWSHNMMFSWTWPGGFCA